MIKAYPSADKSKPQICQMSRKSVLIIGCGLVVSMLSAALFHFGPPGIKAGEDRILSSLLLTNGSKLFLVAHRTGHAIDAYEVSLFRVDDMTNVFVSWLGYEDGYWWGGALSPEFSKNSVKIKVFGGTVATYSLSNDSVIWHSGRRRVIPSFRIDGIKVNYPIPKAILYKECSF